MTEPSSLSSPRVVVRAILAFAIAIAGLQIAVVRPYLWPAGSGLALSGDTVLASLAEPRPLPRMRPPDVVAVANTPVTITRVNAFTSTGVNALVPGVFITSIYDGTRRIDLTNGLPGDAAGVLRVWRDAYALGTRSTITLRVSDAAGDARMATVAREPVWQADAGTRTQWLAQHGGALLQLVAFLAGALALVALGTRGMTARLMTLALIATAIANGGPLYGVERAVPILGAVALIFVWIATPVAFPLIGLAVLHFPSRAAILDRHRWIYPALAIAAAPMLGISLLTAGFLLGADIVTAPLAWVAANNWTFDVSFGLALAANLLIVIEGVGRYRANTDVNERRRIQIVVYTGVPAVFAYALNYFVPVLSSLAGQPVQLPAPLQIVLQAIVLLPAFALPYAVAVKRVFSPRTVLRRSLQYALARRTLSILMVLPVAALVFALFTNRDRPLADIVLGQPLFYAIGFVLAGLGFRYRDSAQRWLDRRFFRAEYDRREILIAVANRVPHERNPSELVSIVTTQIDEALHPESVALLAGEDERLEVVSAIRCDVGPLTRDGGVVTLLRWSDEPLEVFLDDERSPGTRLPPADRRWLATSGLSLLVPIFAGTDDPRSLVGVIGLGKKQSEEPYTAEDRRLLSGIAAQMGVALDLSRLRKRLSTGSRLAASTDAKMSAPTSTPSTANRISGMPEVIDGKYRIEALVGRGGMGAVYRARDLRLGRDVAIKVVRADLVGDGSSRARFEREAQIVARLQHPAIVTVFDYGTMPDGAAFFVMEYVRGEDLRAYLKREGRLPPEQAIDLIEDVAAGIDFAHHAGVLHRDLKPENILLPESGIGPKVLDFGVAKIAETGADDEGSIVTQGATIVGTPAYMAPEQLRGEKIDGRADVFSLAVLTYEALTGRLPFGAGSFIDVGVKQNDAATRLNVDGLPPDLAPILAKALSLSREMRPATAGEFATSLTAASASRS